MAVESLNCPNCGAGVESDASVCKFCKTRLKTIACPSCFGLMFAGAKFCDHCGAIAAPVDTIGEEAGDCPRCKSGLEVLEIDKTKIRSCTRCDGLWMEAGTFETVCADRQSQASVLTYFENRDTRTDTLTKVNYVPCPDCGQLMNRNNFARASGVIVDICKRHGVWFDADELPAIIEFIRKGGMDLARQRQINELNDARDRLRTERHFPGDDPQVETTPGVLSFVRSLFE